MVATRIVMASSSTCVLFEHSLRQCAPYCVNLRQPWKGGPGIAGPAASVAGRRLIRMSHKLDRNPAVQQSPAVLRLCYPFGRIRRRGRQCTTVPTAGLVYCTEQSLATGEKRGNRG